MMAVLLLAMVLSGWLFARARPKIDWAVLILAAFGAVMAHSAVQWAFLDRRLDAVVGDPREAGHGALVAIIAGGEAAGLWLPVLLIPWAQFSARASIALYLLTTITLAAVHFYFPFDFLGFAPPAIAPDGPPYLLAPFVCLPLGAAGYLIGWIGSKSALAD